MYTRRSAATATRRTCSTRCRRARNCTTASATTTTNAGSTPFSGNRDPMNEPAQILPKAKKSVALSGVAAGNTALCTVGRTGNDLHYRGYDILDFAETSEFEEIAYLLIHERLPTRAQLTAYKAKLKSMRSLPAAVRRSLEALPAAAHSMDVMRT